MTPIAPTVAITKLLTKDNDQMKRILFILFLALTTCLQAQISGVVLDEKGEPLVGANVYWAGTSTGVATDFEGQFTLMPVKTTNRLVASFVGCHNDTIAVMNRAPLTQAAE